MIPRLAPESSVTLHLNTLRNTRPRRLVLDALTASNRLMGAKDIQDWIARNTQERPIDPVTIYRVLETLEASDLIHRIPRTNDYTICEFPGRSGPHGFLYCQRCGSAQEYVLAADADDEEERGLIELSRFHPVRRERAVIGCCRFCYNCTEP